MIALIQRVSEASVSINRQQFSSIEKGYIILLGIFKNDTEKENE